MFYSNSLLNTLLYHFILSFYFYSRITNTNDSRKDSTPLSTHITTIDTEYKDFTHTSTQVTIIKSNEEEQPDFTPIPTHITDTDLIYNDLSTTSTHVTETHSKNEQDFELLSTHIVVIETQDFTPMPTHITDTNLIYKDLSSTSIHVTDIESNQENYVSLIPTSVSTIDSNDVEMDYSKIMETVGGKIDFTSQINTDQQKGSDEVTLESDYTSLSETETSLTTEPSDQTSIENFNLTESSSESDPMTVVANKDLSTYKMEFMATDQVVKDGWQFK